MYTTGQPVFPLSTPLWVPLLRLLLLLLLLLLLVAALR
jgi:hypothetical protein